MLIEYCRLFLWMDFSISQKSLLCIAPLTTAVCKFFKIVIGIDFIMLFQSYMYFCIIFAIYVLDMDVFLMLF